MSKPISILIITYNRPDDLLVLLKSITEQNDAAQLLESVIIIDNASTVDMHLVTDFVATQNLPIKYEFSNENLGVARGRNKGIEMAKAPIIVTIDDDAYFKEHDALQKVVTLFNSEFAQQNNVGAYCFKVFYESTGELQKNAFPHKKFDNYKNKNQFLTSYFIGCGHAILKKVYDTVGEYPVDFFYGMEEYDLSYRILNNDYKIAYNDIISILHKESPIGRKPHAEKMQMLWYNKSKVAYRYLPIQYYYSTAILWSFQFLKNTKFDLKMYFATWKKIIQIPKTEKRKVISKKALDYIQKVEGRMWY